MVELLTPGGAELGRKSDEPKWWAAYQRGRQAVGDSAESNARWLCDFARVPAESLIARLEASPPLEADDRWNALYFITRQGLESGTVLVAHRLPTDSKLRRAHVWLGKVFGKLRNGHPAEIPAESWRAVLFVRRGRVRGYPLTSELPFTDAFNIRLWETLSGLAAEHRRLCFCPVCAQPFVTRRDDARTCGPSCRTRAWRKENVSRFREMRRVAYRRKVARKLGKPVASIRIQRRSAKSQQSTRRRS
jgi:hypothetical protein